MLIRSLAYQDRETIVLKRNTLGRSLSEPCVVVPWTLVECISRSVTAIDPLDDVLDMGDTSQASLCNAQCSDPPLGYWIPYVKSGTKPGYVQIPPESIHRHMFRQFACFDIKRDILYRRTTFSS